MPHPEIQPYTGDMPLRSQGRAAFNENTAQFLSFIPPFINQTNTAIDWMNATFEAVEQASQDAVAAAEQTGQDRQQTNQDRQQTAADRQQTTADRQQTGQDRTAVAADSEAAQQARQGAEQARDEAQQIAGFDPASKLDVARYNLERMVEQQSTLLADFARGKYLVDDGELLETTNANEVFTVERATSKWVMGPNGKYREVPPNTVAREWRDGKAAALIEESATNRYTYSSDFSKSFWEKINATITPGHAQSPSGENDATRVQFTGSSSGIARFVSMPSSETTSVTYSVHVKGDSGAVIKIGRDEKTLNGQWQRFSATEVVATSLFEHFLIRPISYGSLDILIWGAQFELSGVMSSYIPTQDSIVTRAADNVSRVLGREINRNGITLVGTVRFDNQLPDTTDFADRRSVFTLAGDRLSHRLYLNAAGLRFQARRADGSTTGSSALVVAALVRPGVTYKVALSTRSGETRIALNGAVSGVESAEFNFSGAIQLLVGNADVGGRLRGALAKGLLIPWASTAEELQELTKL